MLVYAQKFCLSKPVFKIKGKFCGLLLKHWYLSDQQVRHSSGQNQAKHLQST